MSLTATHSSAQPHGIVHRPLLAVMIVAAGMLGACGQSATPPAQAPAPLAANLITVTPQRVPVIIEATGQAEGSKEVEVRARVSGIVQKQYYREGETVRAGAPLFLIERAPYEITLAQVRAAAAQEKARNEQARREAGRLQQLIEQKAISQKEYDDATSTLKQSDASLAAAEAKVREAELNLSYTSVIAPITGVSGRAQRSEGSLVSAGTDSSLLTTVSQTDPVWVRFSFSDAEQSRLREAATRDKEGPAAGPIVNLVLPDGKTWTTAGRLNFAASTVDPKLGTVQLRAVFANPGLVILPGQFVRAQVNIGTQDAFLVPQVAVLQNDQGRYVWTVTPDGKAAQRPVTAGAWQGKDWIIQSGLKNGDRVITDNLLKIRPGMSIQASAPVPAPEATPAASPSAKPADAAK